MPHSLTLSMMAGLSLFAAAGGVYLGRSAVAEINPAYFSEPQTKFHADLVPNRSADWAQVQVGEYQQAALVTGLGEGCIGCRDYPVDYLPVHDPAVDGYQDGWAASTGFAAESDELPAEEAQDPERERIVRYASYPLTREEAAAEAAPSEDEAATEELPGL
jgi:hypothetical protein